MLDAVKGMLSERERGRERERETETEIETETEREREREREREKERLTRALFWAPTASCCVSNCLNSQV